MPRNQDSYKSAFFYVKCPSNRYLLLIKIGKIIQIPMSVSNE